MSSIILSLLWLGLAAFDIWFTRRRIAQYTMAVEINPLIRLLADSFNDTLGIYVGILLPSLLLLALCFRFPVVLAFFVGTRTTLAAFQANQIWGQNGSHT